MTDKTQNTETKAGGTNETQSKSARESAERIRRNEELMKNEKPSLLTRIRSRPYHAATHLISGLAIVSLFAGGRRLGRELDAERTAHEQTQENLNELQGEYGELTRRAREAGVNTDDIGSHNVTYIDRTGTDG